MMAKGKVHCTHSTEFCSVKHGTTTMHIFCLARQGDDWMMACSKE